MPSLSAIPPRHPLRIGIVLFEGTKLLDVCGPLQVFNDAQMPGGAPAYDIDLLSVCGGTVGTDTVAVLPTQSFAAVKGWPWDTLIVSGGSQALQAATCPDLQAQIVATAPHCRRLASVCLGAFILAASGHLKGRRATTHWAECGRLALDYPDIDVVDDAIFVVDSGVWTSAGVTSGIDMALAMIEEDLGTAEALRIAKSLVLPVRRAGGQRQFSDALRLQTSCNDNQLSAVVADILRDPTQVLSVETLAARAQMSPRHFARVFTRIYGLSPARFVEQVRVDRAADAMHQSNIGLKCLVAHSGFSNAEQMRRAFLRVRGVSPSNYRAKFGAKPPHSDRHLQRLSDGRVMDRTHD